MKLMALALAVASLSLAQPAARQTVSVSFQVHYLGADTIKAKYGRKLPKSNFAGSVTGTNNGIANVTFGQGFVLQLLRANGYRALSQQDAQAIVLRAQGSGIPAIWGKYSPVAVKILDDIQGLQVLKAISLPPAAAVTLATADALAKVVQPDIAAVLSQIYQTYAADGIQTLMQLAPGGSVVGTLLFEAEGRKPVTTNAPVFTIEVPVTR